MISNKSVKYFQDNWYTKEEIDRICVSKQQIENWEIISFDQVIKEVKKGKDVTYV